MPPCSVLRYLTTFPRSERSVRSPAVTAESLIDPWETFAQFSCVFSFSLGSQFLCSGESILPLLSVFQIPIEMFDLVAFLSLIVLWINMTFFIICCHFSRVSKRKEVNMHDQSAMFIVFFYFINFHYKKISRIAVGEWNW